MSPRGFFIELQNFDGSLESVVLRIKSIRNTTDSNDPSKTSDFSKKFLIFWFAVIEKLNFMNLNHDRCQSYACVVLMLYRNTKVKVSSPDGDTDYFDIVAGELQGYTLAPYLFIICQDYMLRTSIDKIKGNSFKLTKERSRRYPAKTITDADNAEDIALLVNAPIQAETLLHSLERAAALASMSMLTRRNICALIKQAISTHLTVAP